MDFKINQQERDALKGLPHLARLAYFEAIRPYMDFDTGIVGIKRGISYQSLGEELYVESHVGYVSGSPSKQQLRRALKTLERASLISIQSVGKKLILKCELASVIKKFNPSNIFSISIYSADKSCVTHPDCSSRNCFRVLLRKS